MSAQQSFSGLNIGGDFDVDGISDEVDTNPSEYSNAFRDLNLGGTTEGIILSRGDQILTIIEEPYPDGVRIIADAS